MSAENDVEDKSHDLKLFSVRRTENGSPFHLCPSLEELVCGVPRPDTITRQGIQREDRATPTEVAL